MDEANQAARRRAAEALDRVDAMLEQLAADAPARERRIASEKARLLAESAAAAPEDPPATRVHLRSGEAVPVRHNGEDWNRWARANAAPLIARERDRLVEAVGQALAVVQKEMRAEFEQRLEAVRAECKATVAAALTDILTHLAGDNSAMLRAVDARLARMDALADAFARAELRAWPTIDAKPNGAH